MDAFRFSDLDVRDGDSDADEFLSDASVQDDSPQICWIEDLDLCKDWSLPPGPPYRPDQTLILALFS